MLRDYIFVLNHADWQDDLGLYHSLRVFPDGLVGLCVSPFLLHTMELTASLSDWDINAQ